MTYWNSNWYIPPSTNSLIYWSGNVPITQTNYDPNTRSSVANSDRIICGKGFFEILLNVNGYSYTSPLSVRIDLMKNNATLSATYSNYIIKYNVASFTLKDNLICNWLYDNSAGTSTDYFQINIVNNGLQSIFIQEAFINTNRLS